MKFIDLTGGKFFRLTVLGRCENLGAKVGWLCLCECGNKTTVTGFKLKSGNTKSCGCLHAEGNRRTHGLYRDHESEHSSWSSMRSRCLNPNHRAYKYYGGRGIQIDRRWDSFSQFVADMGKRPPGTSLDRIDPNGNYTPSNCRWATIDVQSMNKRPRLSRNNPNNQGVPSYGRIT